MPVRAQQTACNCQQAMQTLIAKVESEYPGFSIKTQNQAAYLDFKESLTKEAAALNNDLCPQILKKYIDFFKDPHLWVGSNGAPFSSSEAGINEKLEIDIPAFIKQVKSDALEDVWMTEGYTVGLKKHEDGHYTGFIIEAESKSWQPGDVKFRLYPDGKFVYYLMDRSKREGRYNIHYKTLLFQEEVGVVWTRQTSQPLTNEVQEKRKELQGFYIKQITPQTSVFKLPSFEYHNLGLIDSLITSNKNILENTENLIIDLRGNPGGTTTAYQKLLPYISGSTIRHTSAEFLATETYINNLEAYKKTLDKNADTRSIDANIKTLRENLGKFVNFNLTGESFYTEKVVQGTKRPKHVLILANKGTGSSAEYFLFIAKQSKSVKIMGTPSYGALDYGNAYLNELGCTGYQIFMPTYRALRLPDYPVDNIGIQPDIYVDPSVNDWIQLGVDYLEN